MMVEIILKCSLALTVAALNIDANGRLLDQSARGIKTLWGVVAHKKKSESVNRSFTLPLSFQYPEPGSNRHSIATTGV